MVAWRIELRDSRWAGDSGFQPRPGDEPGVSRLRDAEGALCRRLVRADYEAAHEAERRL